MVEAEARARARTESKEIWVSEKSYMSDPLGLEELRTLPRQLPQLAFMIVVLFVGIYFNCWAMAYLQMTMGDFYKSDTKLYDLLFQFLPLMSDKSHWCDGIVFILNFGMLARFAIFCGPRSLRLTILRRWMTCFGILFFLRGCTMVCTVLPNPDDTCQPRLMYPDNPQLEAFRLMAHLDITCQDVLYSGHTVNITLACCVWVVYSRHSPIFYSHRGDLVYFIEKRVVPFFFVAVCILSYLFIISTRFHYSVDVFLGAWLSLLVFWGYHQAMCIASFRQHRPFHRFINWLERGAPDLDIWLQTVQDKRD